MILKYHLLAFLTGFVLDLFFGDPVWIYHPVRLVGNFISFMEKRGNKEEFSDEKRYKNGVLLVILTIAVTAAFVGIILFMCYFVSYICGIIAEAFLTWTSLALRSLRTESAKVGDALEKGDGEKAKKALSMIVGRDTETLDEEGIIKAAVETVAENTSDGVIAPMIYLAVGGPILGWIYKAINTMDSMVGYHSDKYEFYGKAAARLDDAANFIPARISALFMIISAFVLHFLDKSISGFGAARIFVRDRYNHKSPNSAQTESACAGALGIRLGGDAYYFGKLVKKDYIGDGLRRPEIDDIRRSHALLYMTSFICFLILSGILNLILNTL